MRYLLQLPTVYDSARRYPLWLALHGAFATAEQMVERLGRAAGRRGAILLAPQASRPCGDGFCWSFARDAEGIDRLLAGLPYALDRASSALVGYSMGCTMGGWVLGRHPETFGLYAAVGMGSAFEPWELDDGGIDRTALGEAAGHTRFFLAVDRLDPGGSDDYFDDNLRQFADKGFACSTYRPSKATHDFTDAMRRQILRLLPAADRDNPK